jgi:Cof subfamily protein (haloacid dehalogenase superfamily)
MIKLVIADVDGTLVTQEKVLTERAKAAVKKLREAGVQFAVTSGRPPRGMAMLVEPLALTTPIAGFNGGMFVKPDMTPIDSKSLDDALVAPIVRAILARGLDAWVYRGNDWFVRDVKAAHVAREQWTVQFPPIVTQDLEHAAVSGQGDGAGGQDKGGGAAVGVVKIVGVSDDHAAVQACEAELQGKFGDKVSAARSQPYYVDVTHPRANKGDVVRRLSEMLKIPTDQIATIGDMPNDVLMFTLSGLSIAMGNASAEVQKSARRVTRSNSEEGFAEAMERLVLGSTPDTKGSAGDAPKAGNPD